MFKNTYHKSYNQDNKRTKRKYFRQMKKMKLQSNIGNSAATSEYDELLRPMNISGNDNHETYILGQSNRPLAAMRQTPNRGNDGPRYNKATALKQDLCSKPFVLNPSQLDHLVNSVSKTSNDTNSEINLNPPSNQLLKTASTSFPNSCIENNTNMQQHQDVNFVQSDHSQGESSNMNSQQNKPEVDVGWSNPFPDLILFYHQFQERSGVKFINRCLQEFSNYGQINVNCVKNNSTFYADILYNRKVLSTGEGKSAIEAQQAAAAKLIRRLQSTNYVIESKREYFTKKVPAHVRKVDGTQSHIYKVVCLKKLDDSLNSIRFQLSGDVDYVGSEDEILEYIEKHLNSDSQADLYVLNVEPIFRQEIMEICRRHAKANDITATKMVGVSNRGVTITRNKSIRQIFQELKNCGGENMKYQLVPPGCKIGEAQNITNEEEKTSDPVATERDDQEYIEISSWIADKLVLMDYFTMNNSLQSPYNIIRLSVRDCRQFEDFHISKIFDKNTSLFTAEALIDNKVVGRAREYTEKTAKDRASSNALQNLKRNCIYIKAKMSYFEEIPPFPGERDEGCRNKIFRVVHPSEVTCEEEFGNILMSFKRSKLEDLFFLGNFSKRDRKLVTGMAKDMRLEIRLINKQHLCVYKRCRPWDIYKELRRSGENQKYKLELLPEKSTVAKPSGGMKHPESDDLRLQKLFDFAPQGNQQVKDELNESNTFTQEAAVSAPSHVEQSRNVSCANRNRSHSGIKKRSFTEGPETNEELLQHPYSNTRNAGTGDSFENTYYQPREMQNINLYNQQVKDELNEKNSSTPVNAFCGGELEDRNSREKQNDNPYNQHGKYELNQRNPYTPQETAIYGPNYLEQPRNMSFADISRKRNGEESHSDIKKRSFTEGRDTSEQLVQYPYSNTRNVGTGDSFYQSRELQNRNPYNQQGKDELNQRKIFTPQETAISGSGEESHSGIKKRSFTEGRDTSEQLVQYPYSNTRNVGTFDSFYQSREMQNRNPYNQQGKDELNQRNIFTPKETASISGSGEESHSGINKRSFTEGRDTSEELVQYPYRKKRNFGPGDSFEQRNYHSREMQNRNVYRGREYESNYNQMEKSAQKSSDKHGRYYHERTNEQRENSQRYIDKRSRW